MLDFCQYVWWSDLNPEWAINIFFPGNNFKSSKTEKFAFHYTLCMWETSERFSALELINKVAHISFYATESLINGKEQ